MARHAGYGLEARLDRTDPTILTRADEGAIVIANQDRQGAFARVD